MKSEEEQKLIEEAACNGGYLQWITLAAEGRESCWEKAPDYLKFDWTTFDYRIIDDPEAKPDIDQAELSDAGFTEELQTPSSENKEAEQEIEADPVDEKPKPETKEKPKVEPKENIHFSSNNDEWETPQILFDKLDAEFNFSVDLCSSDSNSKCDIGVQELELYVPLIRDKDIEVDGTMFMNPPYSRGKQKKMVGLAHELFLMGKTVVCLLPSRTDTAMFHNYIWDKKTHKPKTGVEMRLLQGRVTFEQNGEPVRDAKGRPQPAPFPSVVVVFRGGE